MEHSVRLGFLFYCFVFTHVTCVYTIFAPLFSAGNFGLFNINVSSRSALAHSELKPLLFWLPESLWYLRIFWHQSFCQFWMAFKALPLNSDSSCLLCRTVSSKHACAAQDSSLCWSDFPSLPVLALFLDSYHLNTFKKVVYHLYHVKWKSVYIQVLITFHRWEHGRMLELSVY